MKMIFNNQWHKLLGKISELFQTRKSERAHDPPQTQNDGQNVAAFTVLGDRGTISRNETK